MTDYRRSKQDDPVMQEAINKRKKIVNKLLSDIKRGKLPKVKIIKQKAK